MAEVTIKSNDAGAPEGHEERMVAKAEGRTEDSLIAGKFKTQEDLDKATQELLKKQYGEDPVAIYKALEKSLGKPAGEDADGGSPDNADDKAGDAAGDTSEEAAREAVKDAGLDFDAFSNEFAEKGELSEDSFKKLEAAGIPREIVEGYINGQQATNLMREQAVYAKAGGEESYSKMTEWAAENWSKDQIELFNNAIGGDEASVEMALTTLQSSFEKANGKTPTFVKGNPAANSGESYANKEQWMRDMKDPRYRTDPAFQKEVIAKLERSKF